MPITEIHNFISDLWKFLKKYLDAPETGDFWHGVVHDSDAIWRKYNQDKMVGKMLIDATSWIEQNHRKEQTV